jgi:hypothetical protein
MTTTMTMTTMMLSLRQTTLPTKTMSMALRFRLNEVCDSLSFFVLFFFFLSDNESCSDQAALRLKHLRTTLPDHYYCVTIDNFALLTFGRRKSFCYYDCYDDDDDDVDCCLTHMSVAVEERAARSAITLFARLFVAQAGGAQEQLVGTIVTALRTASGQTSGLAVARGVARTLAAQRLSCRASIVHALRPALLPLVAELEPTTRAAAVDTLATLAALDGGDALARDLVSVVQDTLANANANAANKSGCAALLGALARAVGGLRARAFLSASAPLLLQLVEQHIDVGSVGDAAPVLEAALSALWLTIDATGLGFAPHASATLATASRIALRTGLLDAVVVDNQRALGRVVNAVVGALGPELRAGTREMRRCDAVCHTLARHTHALVQLETLHYLQSLLLFAPQTIEVSSVVPRLTAQFASAFVDARAAAIATLGQLAQRDARAVSLAAGADAALADALFDLLDAERDVALRSQVFHDAATRVFFAHFIDMCVNRFVCCCCRCWRAWHLRHQLVGLACVDVWFMPLLVLLVLMLKKKCSRSLCMTLEQ